VNERRNDDRLTAAGGPAKIFVADGDQAIECTICNISTYGACLEVDSQVVLPESFNVAPDDGDHLSYPCRLLWRKENRVGIKFA
jgi:PilZ domain